MQLELEKPDSAIYIKHYTAGQIILPNQAYSNNLILTPDTIVNIDWMIESIDNISPDEIEEFIMFDADIYLLGTGSTAHIPNHEVLSTFARMGKPLDFMDSSSACRTFNILANEGRRVIAAIIA